MLFVDEFYLQVSKKQHRWPLGGAFPFFSTAKKTRTGGSPSAPSSSGRWNERPRVLSLQSSLAQNSISSQPSVPVLGHGCLELIDCDTGLPFQCALTTSGRLPAESGPDRGGGTQFAPASTAKRTRRTLDHKMAESITFQHSKYRVPSSPVSQRLGSPRRSAPPGGLRAEPYKAAGPLPPSRSHSKRFWASFDCEQSRFTPGALAAATVIRHIIKSPFCRAT